MKYRGGTRERSFEIFNELGFRSLAKEYAPTAGTITKTYRIVNTPEDLRALADRLKASGRFAMRVLPDQPTAMRTSIVGFALKNPRSGLRADRSSQPRETVPLRYKRADALRRCSR